MVRRALASFRDPRTRVRSRPHRGLTFRDDARRVRLDQLGLRLAERFVYEYDFYDSWVHDVRVEQIAALEAGRSYPRYVGGGGAAPPEDCGGVWAYLEVLKEVDYLTGFTEGLTSVASREVIDQATLCRRLLLVLFGLGTNVGIKHVAGGGETEAVLRRARRLHVNCENLRRALRRVVNATFAVRDEAWWGTGTASDSKRFGSWSSNFMTEWHARYGGPGVMIYWHVERKSVCIYSQLRSCSASEGAAMLEGLLRHSTSAEIDRNYVDTHGASVVGFAFCYLLGFKLMPRLKNIGAARLYRPGLADDQPWVQIAPVVAGRPIDWELIARQYDQMVKYATALRLGTAEADQVLRRFTRGVPKHPTYAALEAQCF